MPQEQQKGERQYSDSAVPFSFLELRPGATNKPGKAEAPLNKNWEVVLWDEPRRCYSFLYRDFLPASKLQYYFDQLHKKTPWVPLKSRFCPCV